MSTAVWQLSRGKAFAELRTKSAWSGNSSSSPVGQCPSDLFARSGSALHYRPPHVSLGGAAFFADCPIRHAELAHSAAGFGVGPRRARRGPPAGLGVSRRPLPTASVSLSRGRPDLTPHVPRAVRLPLITRLLRAKLVSLNCHLFRSKASHVP